MPSSTETKHFNLQSILENMGANTRSYSGRGMFGKQCLGITGPMNECMSMIAETIKDMQNDVFNHSTSDDEGNKQIGDVMNEEFSECVDTLLNFHWDSMGRSDVVVYWEGVPFKDEDGDEDFEEDEEEDEEEEDEDED